MSWDSESRAARSRKTAGRTPPSRAEELAIEVAADAELRRRYLYFLPKLARTYLLVLRAASATLGRDFSEDDWEGFARTYDLPVASTFARAGGGRSFSFAKFLAAVGPLPLHAGGPRLRKGRQISGWTDERLLLGAMTLARMNGGWPPENRWNDVARKARERGVDVPMRGVLLRQLGATYNELRCAATNLAEHIGSSEPEGIAPTYTQADCVAHGMALGVEILGHRPSSETWDAETQAVRRLGVPHATKIFGTFGAWRAGWDYVTKLGLDPGVQRDARPRYTATGIACGMALVEGRLGRRPSAREWTDAVRDLKKEVGAGVIPAKSTIYDHFPSWKAAWLFVDVLRAQREI